MRRYNNNINLIRSVATSANADLKHNVYYALMVTDKPHRTDNRKFFNRSLGWLGLERTSEGKIYISKQFKARNDLDRGITMVVEVNNPALCIELN